MKTTLKILAVLAFPMAFASAQQVVTTSQGTVDSGNAAAPADSTKAKNALAAWNIVPPITMQNIRPADKRGLLLFESPKNPGIPFTGFRYALGASFRQQFQGLEHKNTALPVMSGTTNTNQLIDIGRGFNLADANLSLNMQVADGIRVQLTSYLSAKHHQETWVKDGYALIDKSPIDNPILNNIMKYTTLKLGHFEVNFGDEHFRRSDNGNGLYNPFVGNLIIDAFTTEVGGEVYVRPGPFIMMAGITSGTIQGGVTTPAGRTNAYLGKLGFDTQVNPDLRVRLTGSFYKNDKSPSNTLLTGDRAGSAYDLVMENTAATLTANAWSGQIRPGFNNTLRAFSVNPFLKYRGVELFGTYDNFKGKALSETGWRTWTQTAGELVYRFWDERMFVAGRGNLAEGKLLNTTTVNYLNEPVSVNRHAASAGWFVTPVLLLKGEYMLQKYYDFPAADIRNGGKISGFVVEGVVSF
jgi:hypothetical protein